MIEQKHISSPQNTKFRRWRSLLGAQGIKEHRQCLISGERIAQRLLRDSSKIIREILLPPSHDQPVDGTLGLTGYTLTRSLFDSLDTFGTGHPLLICDIPHIPPANLDQPPSGLEVLCPMGDPRNLGAILRSCLALGVQKVILLQESAHPFHPTVIRASSGAVFFQPLEKTGALESLNTPGTLRWITALDHQGKSLAECSWQPNLRLLIGEEGVGIPPYHFPHRLRIPQQDPSIPFNAAVAGSIALHAYRQQYP